ncbi:MurR/RpiR family transcriptional regulator [Brevundimonas lenta]|uniref:DNA-binding MurR/RpiR family transcriptional regulator n=1 Tax=Brevundimonas lenta TaxID=424796 RepID=A0A7W6JBF7_9CAUL|nr:MurR/RpiR family transcriptional regulator [Brevundimonas lenta]MBB4081982.1 DNA-binding MurR/RpiR family transcriptional regulator [Brevundimonas lenta]
MADTVPTTAEELRAAILERYESLSKRLQQIARYVLDEPNAVALETLAVLAERSGVQPSAIVRFAKSFGFDGATQMQRLFRDGLLSGNAALAYGERVRQFSETVDGKAVGDPGQVLAEFIEGNTLALQNLGEIVGSPDMAAAVRLMAEADTIYVAGFRRSFPVAAYIAYSLHQVDKKTVFIDSIGGMTRQQVHGITANDLLIVVSYHPYAEEAVQIIDAAVERNCRVLSISDSLVSPVAKPATLVLQVREAEIRKFRSLSASMCLAQALVISFAFSTAQTTQNRSALGSGGKREAG